MLLCMICGTDVIVPIYVLFMVTFSSTLGWRIEFYPRYVGDYISHPYSCSNIFIRPLILLYDSVLYGFSNLELIFIP